MIKVLWYSDFLLQTGFGNVAEEIVTRLLKTGKYEFTIIAINHEGDPYNEPNSPYYKFKDIPIYPARYEHDFLGKGRMVEFLRNKKFNVFFALQDSFNMVPMHNIICSLRKINGFSYVGYFPIDSDIERLWVTNGIGTADFPVLYTKYGMEQVKKCDPTIAQRCSIIYHGADTKTFFPRNAATRKDIRHRLFNAKDNEMIITNVNRNQPRKDPLRCIVAFLQLLQTNPTAKLYLNMNIADPIGFDIAAFIHKYVPTHFQKQILYPDPRKMKLIDKAILSEIYAASDIVISTSTGEGWGLSTTEAMASGTPVVMPDNTAFREIIGEDRGWLVNCDNFSVMPHIDHETMRPVTSVSLLVSKIIEAKDRKEEASKRSDAALKWVKENCDWDKIANQWDIIFEKAFKQNQSRNIAL